MVLTELAARLNCEEYKNWVKAGHCLLLLRGGLQGFVGREVLSFHQGLLAAAPGLGPRASCRGGSRCSPRARQFQPQCQVCAQWKREILRHHVHRNGDVYWGNCRPGRWPVDAWEVAKAFMPRGLANKQGPEECDAVALLSLINSCDHFVVDRKRVTELIKVLLEDKATKSTIKLNLTVGQKALITLKNGQRFVTHISDVPQSSENSYLKNSNADMQGGLLE